MSINAMKCSSRILVFVGVWLFVAANVSAQLKLSFNGIGFRAGIGISGANASSETAMSQGQSATYQYPDGKSSYKGFRSYSDNVCDWSGYAGLSFDVFLKKQRNARFEVMIKVPEHDGRAFAGCLPGYG